MLLIELANTSYDYELIKNSDVMKEYEFFVPAGDEKYLEYRVTVFFDHEKDFEDYDSLEIMFRTKTVATRKDVLNLSAATDKVTGTGKEKTFKILSTVIDIIKKEIKSNPKIKFIQFGAKSHEESRVKLYNHFVDNVGRYLPGWKLAKVNRKNTSFNYYLEKT